MKADDRMRHPRRAPVCDRQVYARNLGEPHRACVPARPESSSGAVLAIANVMNGDLVAIDFRPGSVGDIRLPGSMVSWLNRLPPHQNHGEADDYDQKTASVPPPKNGKNEGSAKPNDCAQSSERWEREIEK